MGAVQWAVREQGTDWSRWTGKGRLGQRRGAVPRAAVRAGRGGAGEPKARPDQRGTPNRHGKTQVSWSLKGRGATVTPASPAQAAGQWLGQEWRTKRERQGLETAVWAGARQPTSESRRVLRFSLLPVLGPFPLVTFCSGTVTSGRKRSQSAGLTPPGSPEKGWVWVQQKQSWRGPRWGLGGSLGKPVWSTVGKARPAPHSCLLARPPEPLALTPLACLCGVFLLWGSLYG